MENVGRLIEGELDPANHVGITPQPSVDEDTRPNEHTLVPLVIGSEASKLLAGIEARRRLRERYPGVFI